MSARSNRKKRRRLEHQQLRQPQNPGRQLQNPNRQCLEAFKQDFERDNDSQKLLLIEPAGCEKMSDVLEDFYEPFVDEAHSDEDLRWLVGMAVVAWNTSLLPEAKQREMADRLVGVASADGPSPATETIRILFAALLERKHAHFAQNRRVIHHYRLDPVPGGLHLSVASSMDSPPSRSGFPA
ncbi:MAG: hypothetical protein NTY19_27365 [Planctomycetota bacterium]|nr:hypothetical protein [Planctomycetota bacterium]